MSNKPSLPLYDFKVDGQITNVKRVGSGVFYNKNKEKWEKIGLMGEGTLNFYKKEIRGQYCE
jgi:hypothetical protein